MKNILFIVQYPKGIAPSQRFRIELYERILSQNGFQFTYSAFIDEETRAIIFKSGHYVKKVWGVVKGFYRRVAGLAGIHKYDYIFVCREASPLGPPVFEWLYAKVFRKRIIYDFDDAIWVPYGSSLIRNMKCFWKVPLICGLAYKVSVGNHFLEKFAREYNKAVVFNPTCVDTISGHTGLKTHHDDQVTIGWTGSFSTLQYLPQVLPVLEQLAQKYSFKFLVIGDKDPQFGVPYFQFLKWNRESEVEDLLNIDIGIMPLSRDEFSEGKCGFKLIQYMSLGIPAVASPVGANKDIMANGSTGFLCDTVLEWYSALESLISSHELRTSMGEAGKRRIGERYSLEANAKNFLSLFS